MTLSDYLSYIRKFVLRDTKTPPMWPDEVIVPRLNEALQRMATRTHGFVTDSREIELSEGEAIYDLDPDIIFVNAVRLDGFLGRLAPSTEGWTPDDPSQSRPVRYTLDRNTNSIRLYPVPDATYTALLNVARLPATLSMENTETEVEVSDTYLLAPADWVAYRCFSDPDADGFAPGSAAQAKARFDMATNENKRDNYRLKTGNAMRVHGQRVK